MTTLDLDFVRSQFPAFSEPSLQGWAFFENAGGSYACGPVIERLNRYYRQTKLQPYGTSPASRRAGAEMDEAHQRLAGYLNVEPSEVHFGPSTSQNTYVLAHAFRGMMEPGDEIVVTNQDHEANSGAWRRLEEFGMVIREWSLDKESGELHLTDLQPLLNDRTRLVVMPHASNVVGHINPIADVAKMVHAAGALLSVDGVAGAPHGFPDMQAIGADLYLFSLYKTYGPHQGLMVVRSHVMEKLTNQSHYFNDGKTKNMLIPAGPDHAQVACAAGIADYFDAVYNHHFTAEADAAERGRKLHDLFRATEIERVKPLLDYLDNHSGVTLVGSTDPAIHAPTVAVTTHNKPADFIARELAEHQVMVNSGDFYGVRVLNGMEIPLRPGVLRMSFVHYTTEDEINQLMKGLDAVL